jgi:hypothetical protein
VLPVETVRDRLGQPVQDLDQTIHEVREEILKS